MKAYEIETGGASLDALHRVERNDPEPGPGEVLVRVRAAALNARDQAVVAGRYRGQAVQRPTIPLSDGAGDVVAVGSGVSRFAVGDRVAGMFFQGWIDGRFRPEYGSRSLGSPLDGMLAESVVLDQDGLVKVPSNLDFDQAATLPCAAVTAWHALMAWGAVRPGETVLAIGTGGVSIFALQFAKAAGARVVITSSSDEKLERARALGADETVNYRATPEWEREVLRLTDGRGADRVVEVGGATLPQSLAALAFGGRIHLAGFVSGREFSMAAPAFVGKNATLESVNVGSGTMFEAMNHAIDQNGIVPVVDRVFGFDDAMEAYRYQVSDALFGKVVISI